MSKKLLALAAVLVASTAVGLAAWAAERKEKDGEEQADSQVVKLDKIPAAARDALTKLAGSAKIEEVAMEDEDGVKVYEGAWQVKGVGHEAVVTENGDLVETEQIVDLDAIPNAVQRVAKKSFPKGTKLKVEKKTVVLYEVEAKINGKEKEVLVAPTGQRVEIEQEDHEGEGHERHEAEGHEAR